MASILIGWPNRADGATLAGGSWSPALSNIQNRNQYAVARSANALAASTQFTIDLGTTNWAIKAISLHGHNLTASAQWRIMIGTTSGASDVYDSGFISAYQVSFDTDLNEFEGTNYWADLVSNQNPQSQFSLIHTFANTSYSNRYFTIHITDTLNPDGYVELGRLGLWSGISPAKNAEWGLEHGWEDLSEVSFSQSGEMLYEKRRSKRIANFTMPYLTDAESRAMYELMRRAGTTGEVLYVPDPDDMVYSQRFGCRARMARLSALERTTYSLNTIEYSFEELI